MKAGGDVTVQMPQKPRGDQRRRRFPTASQLQRFPANGFCLRLMTRSIPAPWLSGLNRGRQIDVDVVAPNVHRADRKELRRVKRHDYLASMPNGARENRKTDHRF